MNTPDMLDRPMFQSLDTDMEIPGGPPTSPLAWIAFLVGLFSLLASFSWILMPLVILGLALGAVSVWKLSRDSGVKGLGLAQCGLALSVIGGVWSITATQGRNAYFYELAGQNAKTFLSLLSEGKKYEALELRNPENERQITGTNLAQYYEGLDGEARAHAFSLLDTATARRIVAAGSDAQWVVSRNVAVRRAENKVFVTLEMTNSVDDDFRPFQLELQRSTGIMNSDHSDSIALWHILTLNDTE
ncbi:MAG: hypothetical protein KDB03_07675 [Planctomycetales bacterium]|nr:hypothetical protein [Planctomycetales bacterium]